MKTLLLDLSNWDLLTDAAGNIALASEPYAYAQDVASALKLFLGELWYNVQKGISYYEEILGQAPPITYFQALMVRGALTVPGVVSAECQITNFENRAVNGQVLFTDINGNQGSVNFQ